jgi:hypothetical protein
MKLKFDRKARGWNSARYAALLGRVVVGTGLLAVSVLATTASSALAAPAVINTPGELTSVAQASPGRIAASDGFGELLGVFCTSAANCWAVGDHNDGTVGLNEILHLTGQKWRPVSVPSPGGTAKGASSELTAVRCTSAKDCWAVGAYKTVGAGFANQALHWNGKSWKAVPVPSPGGKGRTGLNFLLDVSCVAADNCWSVGEFATFTSSSEITQNLVLHWTGKKWFKTSVPEPAGTKDGRGNELTSVRCASASDCWAAGQDGTAAGILAAARPTASSKVKSFFVNEMLHWNGQKWTNTQVPNPGGTKNGSTSVVNGLSCTAPADCWAAGSFGSFNDSHFVNEVLHWTGRKWFKASVPNPAGTGANANNQLNAIFCVAAGNCWAAGTDGIALGGDPSFGEMLHWNGAKWSPSAVPNPAGTGPNSTTRLHSIRCVSAANCWAVGSEQPSDGNAAEFILHWNGRKWLMVS